METTIKMVIEQKGAAIVSVPSNALVYDCISRLNIERIGALLVMDDGNISGIFSERDVLRKVIGQNRDMLSTQVKEVMTDHVLTVPSSTTVAKASNIMTEQRIRHLPVVDGKLLVGLVSIGDILRQVMAQQSRQIDELVNYIQA